MGVLGSLIAPLSETEFFRDRWGSKFCYSQNVVSNLGNIFSWTDLNRALEHHRFEFPRLRLELKQNRVDPSKYVVLRPTRRGPEIARLDVAKINEFISQGATLIVDSVDEVSSALSALCEDLTRTFCTHVQINAYASTGSAPGFGLHWDDHDVFAIQLSGKKRWKIYGATRLWPLYRDSEENPTPKDAPLWDNIIAAGDVLYIPRGHWHEVIGLNEPTLHLTIGVSNPTGITLVNWLVDQLLDIAEFRQDLPLFATLDMQRDHAVQLLELLKSRWQPTLISEFLDAQRAQLTARPHFSLPFAAIAGGSPEDDSLLFRFTGSTAIVTSGNEAGDVVVRALGLEWQFKEDVRPLLDRLMKGERISIANGLAEVQGKVSKEKLRRLFSTLLARGFLSVEPPSNGNG